MLDSRTVPGRPRRHPAVVTILLVSAAAIAMAMIKKPPPPISLDIDGAKVGVVNRVPGNGWPLTLSLSSNGELGIGRPFSDPEFPRLGEVGYLVFSDPDGCFSFSQINNCATTDETYVEFTPDLDLPALPNPHGNTDRLIALTESGGGGSPRVLTFDFDTHLNTLLVPYGPAVGGVDDMEYRCSSVLEYAGASCQFDSDCPANAKCRLIPVNADGYGYGADDDLPGLVILSDTGVGLVLNQNFNRPRVAQGRNLAGLLNSVSYDLKDGSGRTMILAHMNVPAGQIYDLRGSSDNGFHVPTPRGLFTPAVLADRCVGDQCLPSSPHIVRIDGGPQQVMDDNQLMDFLNTKVVTIRAFVVSGTAPSVVTDLNGDGVVNADDAVRAGYSLLSGEEKVQVRGFYENVLQVVPLIYDFDGNGEALGQFIAPGGPGQITRVPE